MTASAVAPGIFVLVAFLPIWCAGLAIAQTGGLVAQGRQALDADRVDEALVLFEKAVAGSPEDPAALTWLGNAQVRKARTAETFDRPGWVRKGFNTLDEAVERFPNSFVAYFGRGVTAVWTPDLFKKTPVAISDLRTVIAMREKNPVMVPDVVMPGVYFYLGLAYKKSGQFGEARRAWETGRRLYPSAPEAKAIDKELRNL